MKTKKINKSKGKTYEEIMGCEKAISLKERRSESRKGIHLSDYTREKISRSLLGRKRTKESIEKSRIGNLGRKHTPEAKEKMSKKRSEFLRDQIECGKYINPMLGRKHSDYAKKKMRLSAIKRIETNIGQINPNYNPLSCKILNNLASSSGSFIQHAENDGEFYIKELGYWVDGYDKENKIVYEIDENYHFNPDGSLRERDIKRQLEIENFLDCKFVRIRV